MKRSDISNEVTVFLITIGNSNYTDCLEHLQKQTVHFRLDIIREITPLSKAFQEMINRCKTPYYIEVDEDMILNQDAIEYLYKTIKNEQDQKTAMICCDLKDVHYDIPINGIKIYKHEIFKNFSYNLTYPSCEVDQLERLSQAGYKWKYNSTVIGLHHPYWNSKDIYERYWNLAKKQDLLGGHCGFGDLINTLCKKLAYSFNGIDFFALLGAIVGKYENSPFIEEKNFKKEDKIYTTLSNIFNKVVHENKRINILFLFDVYGWVFDFKTRFYKKYSSHHIIPKKFDEIQDSDLDNIDIVIIPGSCHYKMLKGWKILDKIKQRNIKIVVQYNSEIELNLPNPLVNVDLCVAASPKIYDRLQKMGLQNLIYFPHSVDSEFFLPEYQYNNFTLGWTGNPNCKEKRFHLLKYIKYPIKIQAKYGQEYFKKDRSLSEMVKFYNSIDILLILSKSEGAPLPLLEAMSCGKMVLSTDVGIASLLLDKKWLIDENNIIEDLNKKLEYLSKHQEIIIKEGERNRKFIKTYYSFFNKVLILDNIYQSLLYNKVKFKMITEIIPKKIKVVQLARIPCANSGYHLSNLINQYSNSFESRYILGSEYSKKYSDTVPYRKFPYDLFWQTQKEECIKIIKEADIVHIHHGFWGDTEEIKELIKDKVVITTIYDLSLFDNIAYFNRKKAISTLLTIVDQPQQKKIFKKISDYYLPLVNMFFNCNCTKNNEYPLIVYAPTNRLPISNGSSKGYKEVLKIINRLRAKGYKFNFDLIEGVPYEENLIRKQKADIIIDDIVHETYHNSSIEAACFGAVAITNYNSLDYPFFKTNLRNLDHNLIKLITNPSILKEEQQKMLEWRDNIYRPEKLLKIYEETYDFAINLKKTPEIKKEELTIIKQEEIIIEHNEEVIKNEIIRILNWLKKEEINFWLLDESCLKSLQLSCNKKIKILPTLSIGISSLNNKRYILKNLNSKSITIRIAVENRKIKIYSYYGIIINIPCPVKKYLKNLYGENWINYE